MFRDFPDLFFEDRNPFSDFPFIDFKLRFARAAKSNAARGAGTPGRAAALPFEMAPCMRQARKAVFMLCQFNLQPAFMRLRVLSEDIENQRGPVDDAERIPQTL